MFHFHEYSASLKEKATSKFGQNLSNLNSTGFKISFTAEKRMKFLN